MKKTYCIVGAGPCGLMTAKTFKKAGIAFDVFEKHSDVGGIWDMQNKGTPLYDAAHFISSRTKSGFPNFPMPDSFPDYPNHHHILTYIRSYAQHENLYPHIQFNAKVTGVEKHGDDNWLVTTDDGKTRNYAGMDMKWFSKTAVARQLMKSSVQRAIILQFLTRLSFSIGQTIAHNCI